MVIATAPPLPHMRPMTHGETRGALILLALMALVVCATYVVRLPKGESTPTEDASATSSQCATGPLGSDTPLTRRQIDSMNIEDAAARHHISDSVARSARTSAKKSGPKGTNRSTKSTRNKPSRSHSPAPSPLDRPL